MTFSVFISFAGAVLCCGLGAFVLFRDLRSFAHRTFALGMFCLAAERTINGLGAFAVLPEEVLRWRHLSVLAGALLPCIWLLFSLSFGRDYYREFIAKWKWAAVTAFALPLAMATLFNQSFFAGSTFPVESTRWVLPLGWSGYFFYLFFLVGSVTVLMNLEGTLRGFTGSVRWQIKFMVLGVGGLFAARIYTTSQTLLFSSVNTALDVVDSGALIVAAALIVVSLVRLRILNIDLYLSQTLLYKSVTVSVVGLYLLAVGILAKLVDYLGGIHALVLVTFIVFLGLLGLVIVLLADELRQKVKLFINRNLRRPQYDYRKEWMRFTQRTASVVDINCLSASVAAMVSETFGVACVTLWLRDEVQDHVSMYGSTVFPASENANMAPVKKAAADLIHAMQYQQSPIDLDQCQA